MKARFWRTIDAFFYIVTLPEGKARVKATAGGDRRLGRYIVVPPEAKARVEAVIQSARFILQLSLDRPSSTQPGAHVYYGRPETLSEA